MKKIILLALALMGLTSLSSHASVSSGSYTKGKIVDSDTVYCRVMTYQKLFANRGNSYASREMLDLLDVAWEKMKSEYPKIELMQVGDLSAAKGGRISRHKSHQNGLDADIVYFRHNGFVQSEEEPEWAEDFVGKGKVTKNFHLERNWRFIEILMEEGDVNRIFVARSVKNALCDYVRELGLEEKELVKSIEYLRRLRVAKYHRTHLHLRIACPKEDLSCSNQSPPPKGDGCRTPLKVTAKRSKD
jgi:penicillin-insensitive murein DD-endopeptidase